jgi:di/tricarboxylate transporter
MKNIKYFVFKWYPVILAFICLLYSVGLGLMGQTEEAQYSAHWPGTILLFALVIRQRRRV